MVGTLFRTIMAKPNPELESRRAYVLNLEMNATRKINRNKGKGINLAGTAFDVRKGRSSIARLNTKQLDAQAKRLEQFNSRSNSFHRGANNTIITGAKARELRYYENRANARGETWYKAIGDTFVKQSGMTVQERRDSVKSKRVRAGGESTPRLFPENKSKLENINGMRAVDKLIKMHKRRLKADYVSKEITRGRKSFKAMFEAMGNGDLVGKLDELTDTQFAILVKETNFAEETGSKYVMMQDLASGKVDRYTQGVIDTNSEIISDYLVSARSYKASAPQTRKPKKSGAPKRSR